MINANSIFVIAIVAVLIYVLFAMVPMPQNLKVILGIILGIVLFAILLNMLGVLAL